MEKLPVIPRILFSISFLVFEITCSASIEESNHNLRPIIGILSQEFYNEFDSEQLDNQKSYIAASYVKFVESAGARVVPIKIGESDSYYEDTLKKINGVLFPGGDADFNNTNGYADAGERIYRIAKRLNNDGDYFPIWGTCLGFELMTYLAANRTEHRINCNSDNQPLPLEFTPNFKNSKLFGNASDEILDILREENSTGNYHKFCTTEENLAKVNLQDDFRVLSFNHDFDHVKFISTLEHVHMPFYAVQYHPEKNMFEWVKGIRIPHSPSSIKASQYFANFFVNEARKSNHHFTDQNEEDQLLIYNYNPTFTGLKGSAFEQSYFFHRYNTTEVRSRLAQILQRT